MKKIIIYVIVLLIALWIPVNRIDISNLEPIRAIWIDQENGKYVVSTDTEDIGIGDTVEQAVDMMKKGCEKIIYLDTAQYLLVSDNCKEAIGGISRFLKDKVKIGIWDGEGKIAKAATYMQTHRLGTKLKDYILGEKLPAVPDLTGES